MLFRSLPDELETVFALCHQRNFKVMAHATNTEAVKAAVRLGAHSVEHGYIMDEEAIGMLLDSGTWYVPTLSITHLTPSQATSQWEKAYAERKNLAPDLVVRAEAASEVHRQWFQQALAAGVKMGIGRAHV